MRKRNAVKAVQPETLTPGAEHILQTVFPPMVKVEAMDKALNNLCCDLFQAMGIVRLASDAVREPPLGQRSLQDAWAALDGAYELLTRISDRLQDCETMLAKEVSHGND